MERNDEMLVRGNQASEPDELDLKAREAIGNFRASVHAWSDAMFSRPRNEPELAARKIWRLTPGWVLGCFVFFGAVTGGLYESHRQQELAQVAAAREAEQQRQIAAARARQEEDLLAKVDSDISREVPSAMEPLAALMTDEESR